MSYLKDYVYYASGNECPEEYVYWAGLSILGHVLGNKVWVRHGEYKFHPNLYICLVGDAGSGKNSSLSTNIEIMLNHFPELMLSASIQSREDVADLMASNDCVKTWQDVEGDHGLKGSIFEYRPFYILNNELASFLSVDKMKMVEFLTEVFDGKYFSTGFKGQRQLTPERKQWFKNPHVSLIAGAVPTWFMASLKMDLFGGGLGRRLIIVNAKRTKIIPEPYKPKDAELAIARVIAHLKEANLFYGEVNLDPDARAWWDNWYRTEWVVKVPQDPILGQFHQTKPMQVKKVALLLWATEPPFDRKRMLTKEHLQFALALIEKQEEPVRRLTAGIGRNELAGVGAQVIDFIERMGGAIPETELSKTFYRYLRDPEFLELLNHYKTTGQLVHVINDQVTPQKSYLFLPDRYALFTKQRAGKAIQAKAP